MTPSHHTRQTASRIVLVLVGAAQAEIGIWATAAPRSFFDNYPGFGHHWVAMLGPYNEHLVRDYAAAELGFALLLVLAAAWFDRRVVLAAGSAFLLGTLPHFIYHLTTTGAMSTTDNVASLGSFVAELVAVAAVIYSVASDSVASAARPAHKETRAMARLQPRKAHGLDIFRRLTFRFGKLHYGTEMAPSAILAHSKSSLDKLVLGYAEAMTRTPVAVTDEQFAALGEHFDEAQMVELTMAIAAENMFCRTNWALGIESEGFAEGMHCVVPEESPATTRVNETIEGDSFKGIAPAGV
jgi:alkylhydroperoxidase family enzyme